MPKGGSKLDELRGQPARCRKGAHACGHKARMGGPTDLLVPLLPAAVGNDRRVDERALGGHILTQQALHFLWSEAGREVQQFHTPVVSNGTRIHQLPR